MEWQSCVSGKTFKPNKREAGGGQRRRLQDPYLACGLLCVLTCVALVAAYLSANWKTKRYVRIKVKYLQLTPNATREVVIGF